jgi:hypothetical protein
MANLYNQIIKQRKNFPNDLRASSHWAFAQDYGAIYWETRQSNQILTVFPNCVFHPFLRPRIFRRNAKSRKLSKTTENGFFKLWERLWTSQIWKGNEKIVFYEKLQQISVFRFYSTISSPGTASTVRTTDTTVPLAMTAPTDTTDTSYSTINSTGTASHQYHWHHWYHWRWQHPLTPPAQLQHTGTASTVPLTPLYHWQWQHLWHHWYHWRWQHPLTPLAQLQHDQQHWHRVQYHWHHWYHWRWQHQWHHWHSYSTISSTGTASTVPLTPLYQQWQHHQHHWHPIIRPLTGHSQTSGWILHDR